MKKNSFVDFSVEKSHRHVNRSESSEKKKEVFLSMRAGVCLYGLEQKKKKKKKKKQRKFG